jgi:two-component system phosphate regulon response regulator PhoB
MDQKTILIVEDEPAIRNMLETTLGNSGYRIVQAADGQQANTRLADQLPDLILLDWMLPDTSGVELARRWRRDEYTREVPIIMLTARVEETDRIKGLDSGADDYVTKPFSVKELDARIRAVLRRGKSVIEDDKISFENLVLDDSSHRVTINDEPLELGPTEYRLLQFFLNHQERVYSRDQLIDRVWGGNVYIEERTVDVHIRRLRRTLEPSDYDKYIQTVRGAGYRFSKQV